MDRDWQQDLLGFSFADPWALLLVPLVALIWVWRLRRPAPALGFPSASLVAGLPRTLRLRLRQLPLHLLALGLLPVVLALARPQKLTRLPVESEGIDILLCLDVSSSMHATDLDAQGKKHRLDVVKDVAKRFIDGRQGDRVGLVTFALFADLVCPGTLDHEALKRFLADLRPKTPQQYQRDPEDRTAIGRGLAFCVQRLDADKQTNSALARSRVVVLLTDGENNVEDITPDAAAKLAKDAGVRVYTIGAARPSVHPVFGPQKPDFRALEAIATTTGGAFFEAQSDAALAEIFARIDQLERSELQDPLYIADELFVSFLVAGGALIFAAFLLRATWLVEVP
jgi:Ca-activated chloride channel family protein